MEQINLRTMNNILWQTVQYSEPSRVFRARFFALAAMVDGKSCMHIHGVRFQHFVSTMVCSQIYGKA